jgi:thioredoxin 1
MNIKKNHVLMIILLITVGCFVTFRSRIQPLRGPDSVPRQSPTSPQDLEKGLPQLIDLGAKNCIPCRKMAPILEALKTIYTGKLRVYFINVMEHPDVAKNFAVQLIPAQIFYDPSGKELFRHIGFMGREDILAKWRELGFPLDRIPEGATGRK